MFGPVFLLYLFYYRRRVPEICPQHLTRLVRSVRVDNTIFLQEVAPRSVFYGYSFIEEPIIVWHDMISARNGAR